MEKLKYGHGDENPDDVFLDDGAYDRYTGEDLSGDPMLAPDKRPRKLSRKEERERRKLEGQREAIRKEVLAEIEAEKNGHHPPEDKEGEEPARRSGNFSSYLMSVLSGNILSRQEVRRTYPFLLFIALLAFIYIGNVFRMQHLHRKHERLTVEVRELRARSMTIASEKMSATRQSNIIKEIERRGLPLKESLTPNKTIHR